MIITNNFVYIHTSRQGGTFTNKLLLNFFPEAFQVGYHYQREKSPSEYQNLPVIGFVRNPFDWYISMFHDYKRKKQIVYSVASLQHPDNFKKTVKNMLNLGSGSNLSKKQLNMLIKYLPDKIKKPHQRTPALIKSDFINFKDDMGYYSWLWRRMHIKNNRLDDVIYGKFENLRDELIRLFKITGVKITQQIENYIYHHPKLNTSIRNNYRKYYDNELIDLIYKKDKLVFDMFSNEH
jgi:hypothetical protein